MNENWPDIAVAACSILGLFGGALAFVFNHLLKAHATSVKENTTLKSRLVEDKIKETALLIEQKIERNYGDFKELKSKIESLIIRIEAEQKDQFDKYETTVSAIKKIIEKAENRFQTFQAELTNQKFMIDRLTKKNRP